jgi:UrcA family protein
MITPRKLISSLAFATVVSLAAVTTANAGDEQTATVKAWDLDLSKSADVQALYERVRAAAKDVCREEAHTYWRSTRLPAPSGWRARCVKETVDASVREIANPRLAALAL